MALLTIISRTKPINIPAISKFLSTTFTNISAEDMKAKKPKTLPVPRITLVTGEQVMVSTLPEAQKLAKRRDLKLVKILDLDTKSQRPIYKLMTGAEYHAEDLKQREDKKKERLTGTTLKGEKVLILNINISEHDLQIHCNKMSKWIGKRYEVRVVINGDANNMEKAESVFTSIQNNLKDASAHRIVQKRQKGSEIKFQILPSKNENLKDPKIS